MAKRVPQCQLEGPTATERSEGRAWQSLGLQLGLRLPRPLRLESTLLALTYLAGPACVLDTNGPAPPALPDRSSVLTTLAARLRHTLLPAASAAVVPPCRARAGEALSPASKWLAWQGLGGAAGRGAEPEVSELPEQICTGSARACAHTLLL